ncbi:MAG: twin-arginine translocase subunit TatC [Acidiferrobacterales bacterium]
MTDSDQNDEEMLEEGTFLSHLLELRNRLLYSIIAVLVVFAPLAFKSEMVYHVLAEPLLNVLPNQEGMVTINPLAAFLTPLKLSFYFAVVLTIPFLLYQLWAFIAPGLYKHERMLVWPLMVSSTLLFYAGMAFAYFVVFPLVFKFLSGITPLGVKFTPDITQYQEFVFTLFFAFGIAFELPVAMVLLIRAGIVDPDSLGKKRQYVVLGIFTVAMVLTPPDIFSQTLLAIPMLLLFEIGLYVGRRVRPKPDEDEYREMTDEEMDAQLNAVDKAFTDDKD